MSKTKPFEGTPWLDAIKKYEKYIPFMTESERILLIEGSYFPSRKRKEELNHLLLEAYKTGSPNVVERALLWQRRLKTK